MRGYQTPQFGPGAMPGSLAPQIADLGTMIDNFAQRRIVLAKMAEQERANREKDLYYRGRVAAQEARNRQIAENEQTRMDAAAMKEARLAPGAGPIVLHRGGKARMFNPRFDPGAQAQAELVPQDVDTALQGFGRIPGMAPPAPPTQPDELTDLMNEASLPQDGEPIMAEEPPAREPEARVIAVPTQRTRGALYDARNPARDDLEERSRRMYPRQQQDLDVANQALERGESGMQPTPHNKEWADFYGRNASADYETIQREYEAKKAAERADAGPRAEVTSIPTTIVQGAVYRPQHDDDTMFYDENNDGLVQALIGNDEQTIELPEDAFPPGASEGQRFAREDVGEGGRKGNPFAEPVPGIDVPEVERAEIPPTGLQLGEAKVTKVPPTVVKGERHDLRQSTGPRWLYEAEGEEPFVIDEGQRQAAKRAESEQRVAQLERAVQGTIPGSREQIELAKELAIARAGLPERAAGRVSEHVFRGEQAETQLGSREKLAAEANASREKIAAMRKRVTGGGRGTGTGGAGTSDPYYIAIPKTRQGQRADMLLGRVNQEWGRYASEQKLNDQFKGMRRLVQADHNISARGKDSGTVNAEAFLNAAGAFRGGVPVENETKVMLDQRRTWQDRIHGFLARAGLGEAWARLMKGGELTAEEAEKAVSIMSPEERQRVGRAIKESRNVMEGQIKESIEPFVGLYDSYTGPGGDLLRRHSYNVVNTRLRSLGLSPLVQPGAEPSTGGQGVAPAKTGGVSLREALGL